MTTRLSHLEIYKKWQDVGRPKSMLIATDTAIAYALHLWGRSTLVADRELLRVSQPIKNVRLYDVEVCP